MLRDELTHCRDKVARNFHEYLALLLGGGFILSNGFTFGLTLVMLENPPYARFVPAFGKFVVLVHRFLRLRRRYASNACPSNP